MDMDNLPELNTIWDEARNHIIAGNHNKAIDIYNYILIRYGDDAVAVEYAHAYLGDIYLTSQQIDLAEEHIRKAIKHNPEKPDYHYILGFVYTYKRLWEKAIAEFGIAIGTYLHQN
jgi:tetratricopeptide (TPR) repeat protein